MMWRRISSGSSSHKAGVSAKAMVHSDVDKGDLDDALPGEE